MERIGFALGSMTITGRLDVAVAPPASASFPLLAERVGAAAGKQDVAETEAT